MNNTEVITEVITEANRVPKLCLNMIVKNESRIIIRLLESVKDIIDTYCICDTGSTDNTVHLIEEFGKKHNIPGKVIQEPFRNFEYNRSLALKACDNIDADYVLLLDADMIFWKNPKVSGEKFKKLLRNHGAFYIFQGNDAMYYKNTRIVKNKSGFSYKGVTHEYVDVPDRFTQTAIVKDIVFIRDIGDGGAKSDKFSRDVRLLKDGLEKEPSNERYMFYLANSLKDLAGVQKYQMESQIQQMELILKEWDSQFANYPGITSVISSMTDSKNKMKEKMIGLENDLKKEAIKYYEKRIKAGGFWEEVWYSYYNIGKLYMEMDKVEKATYNFHRSFILYPQRVENLYEIVKYYREKGDNQTAVYFYLMGRDAIYKFKSRDYLFIQRDIYDFKLHYEMSILGFYDNPTNIDLCMLCMDILKHNINDDGMARNVLSNYKFYTEKLETYNTNNCFNNGLGDILKTVGSKTLEIPGPKYPNFNSSTPSFAVCPIDNNTIYGLIRFVDYQVNNEGGYDQQEYIQTKNAITKAVKNSKTGQWNVEKEGFIDYDSSHDNLYVGLEDMRLFSHPFTHKIYYTANRGFGYGKMVIEHGTINTDTFSTENSVFLKIDQQRAVEKNWVMFATDDKIRMVYNWYPMVLGIVENDSFVKTHTVNTPYGFKYFRGSTNGIIIGNEIWFLTHTVSYEDRRYYYHTMVMLDKDSFALKRYTKMFTFKQEKVEYCLGMQRFDNELVFGFSIMDCDTDYMSIPMSWFENNIC